jgi:predicted transcriptional regulator of viral defense system
MRSADFFETHPLFTHEEFVEARAPRGAATRTSDNLLAKHLVAGHIIRVRRGLYAVVPRGVDPEQTPVDPYLVATKLASDAVVAYHAALQFHGKSYSLWRRFHYLTRRRARRFSFQDMEFVPVQVPAAVRALSEFGGGVVEKRHAGSVVVVTTLERALVDVLDAPDKAGGWEEIWRSLEMVEFFDLDAVVEHAVKRGSALAAARVGFFLEQHHEELMVEERYLDRLCELVPAQPRYLDARREPGQLVSRWNLIVPERVLKRTWQEVA